MLKRSLSIGPLVVFRIGFGLMAFMSLVRFYHNGWIKEQFLESAFHFKYFGFHWVSVAEPTVLYGLFFLHSWLIRVGSDLRHISLHDAATFIA